MKAKFQIFSALFLSVSLSACAGNLPSKSQGDLEDNTESLAVAKVLTLTSRLEEVQATSKKVYADAREAIKKLPVPSSAIMNSGPSVSSGLLFALPGLTIFNQGARLAIEQRNQIIKQRQEIMVPVRAASAQLRKAKAEIFAAKQEYLVALSGDSKAKLLPPSPLDTDIVKADQPVNYTLVRTFFATDRNLTNKNSPTEMFGADRGKNLSLGIAVVSIPVNHKIGELEAPFTIFGYSPFSNPEDHIILMTTKLHSKQQFWDKLRNSLANSKKKNALLFVHGFNVTFEDAARRTAQLAYDLKFEGVPAFYSWPSKGDVVSYPHDASNIEWTRSDLRPFLENFLTLTEADKVYVIAHSMGTRAVTKTLANLMNEKPDLAAKIEEIVLAAPDIDKAIFRDQIAARLIAPGRPVTLYASDEDKALIISKKANGYARLGDVKGGIFTMPGFDSIDASGMDTGFLKHSYFAESRSVLSDIFNMFQNNLRPTDRYLTPIPTPNGNYWKFKN